VSASTAAKKGFDSFCMLQNDYNYTYIITDILWTRTYIYYSNELW